MRQLLSKPDWHIARTGRLDAVVTHCAIPGAPAFLRDIRALFVTDVHALGRTTDDEIDTLTKRMMDTEPDIILLGGDYSDTQGDALRLFASWQALRAPLGCWGVMGNNDIEAWKNARELRREMAKAGCHLLVNQSERLLLDGGTLIIAGVDEHHHGAPRSKGLYPEAPSPNVYRILLSHYPCRPEVMPELMLCGHTHGGQFNLLGITPYTIGFERFSRPHRSSMAIAGLHDIGNTRLLVSKGIGASRLQLRVGVRPEIHLLTFE